MRCFMLHGLFTRGRKLLQNGTAANKVNVS